MSDRHFELPAHPNLEYYRKQAKQLLHLYADGAAEAVARVADVLGERAAERFLLSDAQFVLAQEHGFRTWAEFKAHIERPNIVEDRPVSRLLGQSASLYAGQVKLLLVELRRGDPTALRRLRAYVPRHADPADPADIDVERRDAQLVIARENGFPTWRELLSYAEKARRDLDERHERWERLEPAAEALLAGDTGRLAELSAEQATDLLHMLAMPERIPGRHLGRELGVPRAAVDLLLHKADSLDVVLSWAVQLDRVEYVQLLLAAGADLGNRQTGNTPLEHAIYHGHTEMVDVLAEHAIVPPALWTYAACGRLDLVRACFDADGRLCPESAKARPDVAPMPGMSRQLPPTGAPEELLAEAFVYACLHGRTEVVRWLLDRGVSPDVAPSQGWTGLHWAIMGSKVDVVRLLLERGADPSRRESLFQADADLILHIVSTNRAHDPTTEQIHALIRPDQSGKH
ncbi:ankyrin repeat domain-containing protein [Flindersiella endophytica]